MAMQQPLAMEKSASSSDHADPTYTRAALVLERGSAVSRGEDWAVSLRIAMNRVLLPTPVDLHARSRRQHHELRALFIQAPASALFDFALCVLGKEPSGPVVNNWMRCMAILLTLRKGNHIEETGPTFKTTRRSEPSLFPVSLREVMAHGDSIISGLLELASAVRSCRGTRALLEEEDVADALALAARFCSRGYHGSHDLVKEKVSAQRAVAEDLLHGIFKEDQKRAAFNLLTLEKTSLLPCLSVVAGFTSANTSVLEAVRRPRRRRDAETAPFETAALDLRRALELRPAAVY